MQDVDRIRTADGRVLEYLTSGPQDGPVLLFHLGTPNAATDFRAVTGTAGKLGLRTVTYSRPGYGESTPRPGRTVSDEVDDVLELLDAVGADAFVTLGWSGGGPHALACAALMADRCRAAALLAGVAPYTAAGLDFVAGMDEANVAEFAAAVAGAEPLTVLLQQWSDAFDHISAELLSEAMHGLLSDVDRAVLTHDFAEDMATAIRRALLHGIAGWRDDDLAFVRPWGFELDAIKVPVAVWQGAHDRMVPFTHGRWLAEHISGCEAHLFDEHGHLSLIRGVDQVLESLLIRADWR
jgi:pimeloyl-ACP methyl ester carboxylesterase